MPRKITQKRRLSKRKQRKDKPRRKTRGGSGAAAYMTQVAGDMHNQHGVNGLLKYTPIQGGGGVSAATQAAGFADKLNNQMGGVGAEMAVPVVLMLANQVAPKILRGQRGGAGPEDAPKIIEYGYDNLENIGLPKTKVHPPPVVLDDPKPVSGQQTVSGLQPVSGQQTVSGRFIDPLHDPNNDEEEDPETISGVKPQPNTQEKIGGGMLETIAVPAALVLASNYFGKRSRRAVPPQNRYTRK
jgi:hypothetical protein